MAEKNFVDGLIVERSDKAPEWVTANLGFNAEKFIKYLKEHTNAKGYMNVTLKVSQKGKHYAELNTWEKGQEKTAPTKKQEVVDEAPIETIEYPTEEINPEDIPF